REQVGIARTVGSPTAMHGFVTLQYLYIKSPVIKRRARAVGPLIGELAVILLKTARPQLFAGEIERRQIAGAVKEKHDRSVRDRRRRSEVAHAILAETDADILIPKDFSGLPIEAHGMQ